MSKNYAWVVAALLAVFLFAGGAAFAQTSSGQIAGRVIDPDAAVVVGAQVTLTNQETSVRWTAQTDSSGLFVFPALQPGTYSISVEATGFKDLKKRDLHLSASERLSAGDLKLEVGAVTETVTVTAAGTAVQTQSGERSALLDSNEMQHLSTPGRDTLALVRLLPGVVKNGEGAEQLGTESAGAVSGTREVSNSISVDGVNGNPRGGGNRFDTPLNMEAVSEVKVLLNDYQAEYGQSGGAVVNIVTKSGTQNFHGEAYYYNRNEAYNANDTFNKSSVDAQHPNGLPRPQYRYNTIGYNLGGPVYWPGKFNTDKKKLFFFFSQEIWPSKAPGTSRYFMMPTALEKRGDFSQSVDKQGHAVTLTDPMNCGTGNQACLLDPTHINSAFINSNMQALLNIFPTGNATPLGTAPGGGLYNYVIQTSIDRPVDQQVLRLDFNITDKWHLFFRGTNMSNKTKSPTDSAGFNAAMLWGPSFFYDTPNRNAAIGITFAPSTTLVNEFTAGYADWRERSGFVNPADLSKFQRGSSTGVNLGQFNPSFNPLNLIPNFTFGGGGTSASAGFGIGQNSTCTNAAAACAPEINFYTRFPFNNNTGTWEYTDGLSKIWDKHAVKVGVFWQNGRYVQHPIGNQFNGTFSFNVSPATTTDSRYAYANALLGNYNSYTEGSRTVYAPKWKILEWYVQDNWRVTHKLTLDYGLRFSYDFPYTLDPGAGATFVPDRYNRGQVPVLYRPVTFGSLSASQQNLCAAGLKNKPSNSSPCAQNPNNPADVLPSGAIGQFVSPFNFTGTVVNTDPTYPRSLRNSNGVLYAPRLGISFDPWGDGKTAIRAGAGIFYNLREDAGVVGDFATTAPVIGNTRVDLGSLANTFAANCNTLPAGCANTSSLQGPQDTKIMPINHKIASTISAHFGVQRDLGFATVLDVSYVGTFGRHLEVTPNINEVPYLSQFLPQNLDPTKSPVSSLGGTVTQQAAISDNFFRPNPGYATIDLREYVGTSNYNSLQVAVNRRFSKALQFGVAYTWSKTMSYSDTTSTGTATDRPDQGAFAVYQDPRFWNYALANIDRTHDLVAHWVYSLPKASSLWNNKVLKAVADNWEWSGIAEFVSGAPQLATISISNVNFTGGGDGTRILLFGNPYASSDQRRGTYQFLDVSQFRLPPIASKAIGVIDPSAIPSRSTPGFTGRATYRGPGTNNWDMTLAKNIHFTERVNFQFRCEAYNVFNHPSYDAMQNTATFDSTTGKLTSNGKFGALTSERGARLLQLVGKITF
jgi:hypothetical protein